jgi:drug efflux transport system ATP-binding protein
MNSVHPVHPVHPCELSSLAVQARDLTRRFGAFVAVDHLNLDVPKGVVFGFLGPNGSGKSTTIRMLCGLLAPSSGSAVVGGFDIERQPEELRAHLGYMSQRFSLYDDLTVSENLEFFGGVYGLAGDRLRARRDAVLAAVGLNGQENQMTAALSFGWKQRLALASALLHEPPLVFLDEPTSGVDPASRRLFWEVIDDLSAAGVTTFVTTHAMDEAERCDGLAFIYRSRLIAQGSPAELKAGFTGDLYRVEAAPLLKALEAARAAPGVLDASLFGTGLHVALERGSDPDALHRALDAASVQVTSINPQPVSLEDVFVALMRREGREAQEANR